MLWVTGPVLPGGGTVKARSVPLLVVLVVMDLLAGCGATAHPPAGEPATVATTHPPVTSAAGCLGLMPGLVTGTEVYPVPELAQPAPRQWFEDPTFGTCLVRLTDREADPAPDDASPGLVNEYARVQAFNADGSRLLVYGTEGAWYLYDAETLQPLQQLPLGDEPRWDAGDPGLLFYISEARLMSYRLAAGTSRLVHDFAADLPGQELAAVWTCHEGSPSADRRTWACLLYTSDAADE